VGRGVGAFFLGTAATQAIKYGLLNSSPPNTGLLNTLATDVTEAAAEV
jgi:hypothetical protein